MDEILNVNVNFKRPEPDAEFCKEVNNTLVKKLESVTKYLRLTVVWNEFGTNAKTFGSIYIFVLLVKVQFG